MIAFLAFVVPLTLFVRFPSTLWNFDGVACAAALELGQPAYFFHANHLWYGFLGFLFWTFIGHPIGLVRALPALQLFTSMLAAAGLVGLYRLLAPLLKNQWLGLFLTSSLAFTAAFWVWSIEAQVYALGFLALAWATVVLIQSRSAHKYAGVGLLHAGAVLGHLMHFLWIIPALYWLRHEKGIRRRALFEYVGTLLAVTSLAYVLVLRFVIAPGRDFSRILIWLKGSAGLTPDRSWAWHSAGIAGPWIWLKSTLPSLWGSFWPYGNTLVSAWCWAITIVSMGVFALLLFRGVTQWTDPLARFAGLWLVTYGLFLSTWEPMTLCYRMTDVLPLGLLLALGLRGMRTGGQSAAIGLLLLSLISVNLSTRILPMNRPDQNPVYKDMLRLSKISSPDSLYITEGGLTWIYFLYFTGRAAWNSHSFEPPRLEEEIARQKRLRPVYVQKGPSWQKVQ